MPDSPILTTGGFSGAWTRGLVTLSSMNPEGGRNGSDDDDGETAPSGFSPRVLSLANIPRPRLLVLEGTEGTGETVEELGSVIVLA